jgi:hypothetical protein
VTVFFNFCAYNNNTNITHIFQNIATVLAAPTVALTTACCKDVSLKTSSEAYIVGERADSAVTITVGTAPSSPMKLSLSAIADADGTKMPLFVPKDLSISAAGTYTAQLAAGAGSGLIGTYTVSITDSSNADGAAALSSEFDGAAFLRYILHISCGFLRLTIRYTPISNANRPLSPRVSSLGASSSTPRFSLFSAEATIPPPLSMSAAFAADGQAVVVSFDKATDRAGQSAESFKCSSMFRTAVAEHLTDADMCVFATDTTIVMYSKTVVVNSRLSFQAPMALSAGLVLKAKCHADVAVNCVGSGSMQDVPVHAPAADDVLLPSPALWVPASVGSCDDVQLDMRGSVGSGGRPWNYTALTVSSASEVPSKLAQLQSYLDAHASKSSVFVNTSRYLTTGMKYGFESKRCNFLGGCASIARSVLVQDGESVPVVQIHGAATRVVKRMDPLTITSTAYFPLCDGRRLVDQLTFSWTVSVDGIIDPSLVSKSNNPSKFVLPAYSLDTSAVYDFTVTVSRKGVRVPGEETVSVLLVPGDVHARVVGSARRDAKVGETVYFDSSVSGDDDIDSVGTGTGDARDHLTFQVLVLLLSRTDLNCPVRHFTLM